VTDPAGGGVPGPTAQPSRGKAYLALVWLVPVAALFLVVGYVGLRTRQPTPLSVALARGEHPPAPAFRLARLDGGEVDLASLRGRFVVMNFWASWCVPCKDEAPLVERVWREYRDRGVVVIGVNVQDLESEARKFIANMGVTYPNVRDRDGTVSRAYGITGIPETFFIDRQGRVIRKFPGAAVEWRTWSEAVEQVLAGK